MELFQNGVGRVFKFSIVIPCYRDETPLARLLEQLRRLPHQPDEIIVVDAADSIRCAQLCEQSAVIRLITEPCRGLQLGIGAAQARGDVIWFLHADAQLAADPLPMMVAAIQRGAIGGYFRFRFAGQRAWPAAILEPAIALRCRLGVPYGDQGIFMQRMVYHQAGGHASWPLFEEVPLVKAARRLGRFVALPEPVFVDSRRWQRDGWWRRSLKNRLLALRFMSGAAPQDLVARYHSKNGS
ncbi:TIGR04283 family arsenosugar biosynthesis glycosyltransferase [Nitrosomonas sp. wSCUT-2]